MNKSLLAVAVLFMMTSCAVTVGPDDIPDEGGEVLTDEEIAIDEEESGEEAILIERGGAYDYGAANTHAGRVNPHRRNHGRNAIDRASCLDGVARRWARRMASGACGSQEICHRPDSGPSSLAAQVSNCWSWARAGENVGVGGSEASLWSAFLGSPDHHANIDHGWNTGGDGKFGVGVYRRGDGRVFITHVFATRR